jgi:NAD(P)H-hydrate epimerase
VYKNRTGNPGMATGGSGDILGGIIAALIGQGLDPFEASVLGVYAHGLAGDIAKDQNGEIGMIAGDIVDSLADAFVHLGPG